MSKLLTLDNLDLENKKVLVRVDYNVIKDGKVIDEFRVRESIPTIEYLLERNCSVILMSHNDRPNGKKKDSMSLRPVAKLLPRLLNRDVIFLDECKGEFVETEASYLRPGDVMLLENLRFEPGEETNDKTFAKQLAGLADVYVDDAFGAIHRAHASTVGVAKILPHAAGLLVEREYDIFTQLMTKPAHPYVAIIGGAKISDKVDVLKELVKKVDSLLIGGAMANTFLAAVGHPMGTSLVEKKSFADAKAIIALAIKNKVEIVLPSDLVVTKNITPQAKGRVVTIDKLKSSDKALDVGPHTIEEFCKVIAKAKTVFWNGTLGYAELPAFAKASDAIAKVVLNSDARSIIGGGDTAAFVNQQHYGEHFGFISTGGGASLELLAGKKLPGLEVLMKK